MDVYFVRHGETYCNRKHVHQAPSSTLTDLGREQSVTAAEYLRKVNPDYILTSDYTRAMQTAGILGSILGLTPETSDFFREIRRPALLYGKSHYHPLSFWYVLQVVSHRGNFHWRYHDAENFMDIRRRIKDALMLLRPLQREHNSVIVVSHAIYLNLLIAYMCENRVLELRDLIPSFLHMTQFGNGDVIHVKYIGDSAENTCSWQLESYWKPEEA